MLWGAMLEGFAWGVHRRLRGAPGARAIVGLLVLSGVAVQAAALVRDDRTGTPSTLGGLIHGSLATIAFSGLLGAMWMSARTIRSYPLASRIARRWRELAITGLVIGSLFELQLMQSIEGLLQRAFYLVCAVWLWMFSGWLRSARGMPERSV